MRIWRKRSPCHSCTFTFTSTFLQPIMGKQSSVIIGKVQQIELQNCFTFASPWQSARKELPEEHLDAYVTVQRVCIGLSVCSLSAELCGSAAGHPGPGAAAVRASALPGLLPARAQLVAAWFGFSHEGPGLPRPRPLHNLHH